MKQITIVILTIIQTFHPQGVCYCYGKEVERTIEVDGESFTVVPLEIASSPPSQAVPKPKSPQNLFQMDSRNFDSSIADGNVWLVEFYAPWCSHCKRFEKQYELVAKKLHDESPRVVKVGKVDGAAEKALSARFSVRGYPVFFLIDGWTVREYDGQRSVDALVNFSTKDWEDVEPIPFINSPFGPMGQLRSHLMSMGTKILDAYEYLVETRSLSPAIASIILGGAGIMIGVIVIISIGLLLESKLKKD